LEDVGESEGNCGLLCCGKGVKRSFGYTDHLKGWLSDHWCCHKGTRRRETLWSARNSTRYLDHDTQPVKVPCMLEYRPEMLRNVNNDRILSYKSKNCGGTRVIKEKWCHHWTTRGWKLRC
jgi:hypothetical protein